jgi:hypothetical protein
LTFIAILDVEVTPAKNSSTSFSATLNSAKPQNLYHIVRLFARNFSFSAPENGFYSGFSATFSSPELTLTFDGF